MDYDLYWLYLIIGISFLLVEIFSLTFYFLPIGLAAILTGIFAIFTNNVYFHVGLFSILGIFLFFFISKWKKSRFLKPKGSQHIAGLVGQQGIVVENYQSPQISGKVKIFSDVWEIYWDIHQENSLRQLKEGDVVKVISVEGNKIKVEKLS
ncbi:NfeD family protein [Pigmentibacter sp. JX0631]|uniref:NfeD family protein n=1 Tax=Pigmentibacter TaxID=2838409 RepID=UPI00131C4765|nr:MULTISPECIES: NfeD family protein [Pigmentibacter]WGL59313.1 NfeD family protein [Pigmentibacter sp. JX0631]BFD32738.1 hypothetical protein GTC16762_23560 [Pigmentibacter ruber]